MFFLLIAFQQQTTVNAGMRSGQNMRGSAHPCAHPCVYDAASASVMRQFYDTDLLDAAIVDAVRLDARTAPITSHRSTLSRTTLGMLFAYSRHRQSPHLLPRNVPLVDLPGGKTPL